jgi:chaperonin cofactor prefoldin
MTNSRSPGTNSIVYALGARIASATALEAPMVNNNEGNPHGIHERDLDERLEAVGRRHRWFGIGGAGLAFAILGLIWYAYPLLTRHDLAVTRFAGVQKVVDTLGDRVKDVDAKIGNWSSDQQDLRDQMAKLSHRLETRMQAVHKQAQQTSAELLHRVQAQIESQMQGMQTRLTRLESADESEQMRMAGMQRELAQVQSQTVKQGE